MITITSLNILLNQDNQSRIKRELHAHLKQMIINIHKAMLPYLDKIPLYRFSLHDSGPLYILEPGDAINDLHEVGLNACDQGLFGCIPETVRKLRFDGSNWFEIAITYNNDYMPFFYLNPDNHMAFKNKILKKLSEWSLYG